MENQATHQPQPQPNDTTNSTNPTKAIIIYSEIEEQEQVNELIQNFNQGYTSFTSLGGGLSLLTKEPIEISNVDSAQICSIFRFNKTNITNIPLTSGRNKGLTLELHNSFLANN